MAVKVDQINALQETSTLLNNYATNVRETVSGVNTKISAKFEGQQAEALSAYLETINEMTSKVFIEFPTAVTSFSTALSTYHASITGEGFSSKVRSSKPGVEEDYCVKVTGDEQPTMEEALKKAKTTFDEVLQDSDAAAVIGGDPVSTISTATTTFNDELKSRIDAIKTTRSNLEQANKAVIAKLKEVTSKVQECSAAMNNFSMLSDPTNGFSAGTVISLIKQGKLNADNIGSTLAAIQKENDAKAIEYALVGDYEKYFDLDPTKISEVPNQLLVLKLSDMLHFPQKGDEPIGQPQFKEIINQLLKSGNEVHVEGHLANMMKASDALALQYASLLAGNMDGFGHSLTGDEKLFLEDKLAKMNAMGSLYMTLQAIEMPDEASGYAGDHNIKMITKYKYVMKNLELSVDNDFTFGIETTTKIAAGDYSQESKATKNYVSSFYSSVIPSKLGEDGEKLHQLQKERQEYLQNLIKNQTFSMIGIFNPAIGSGLQALDAIMNKKSGEAIKNASSFGKEFINSDIPYAKGLKNSTTLAGNILNAMAGYQDMVDASKDNENKIKDSMIGLILDKGGRAGKEKLGPSKTEVIVAECGLPTVESIQRLNELNAHGISRFPYKPAKVGDSNNMQDKITSVTEKLKKENKKNGGEEQLTKAQEYVMGIGGHKLGEEGCGPSQVNNALEEFASQAGMTKKELYDYIEQIPNQKK